jgi:hypothetical protein
MYQVIFRMEWKSTTTLNKIKDNKMKCHVMLLFLGTFCLAQAANTNSVDYVGKYAWAKKAPDKLKATFTPVVNSNDVWSVNFEALYQGKVNYYVGSAKGKLNDKLKGEANNLKNKKKWWLYEVVCANGILYGKHWKRGKQYTGTFELSVKPETNVTVVVEK